MAGSSAAELGGLSCREREAPAEAVPEGFRMARLSVSRRFIRSGARVLRLLEERRLDDAEWLALVLDGRAFADDHLVVAFGVTATGEMRILGLMQTASDNHRAITSFLRELGERDFPSTSHSWPCCTVQRACAPPCARCSATCPSSGFSGISTRTW